jgi:hypothetical protein
LLTVNAKAQDYAPALNRIAEALYVDSDVKKTLEYKLEIYKEKVPKELKPAIDVIIPLTDILIKRRVEFNWEFK